MSRFTRRQVELMADTMEQNGPIVGGLEGKAVAMLRAYAATLPETPVLVDLPAGSVPQPVDGDRTAAFLCRPQN